MTLTEYLQSLADESKKPRAADLRKLSGLDLAGFAEFRRLWPAVPLERRRQIVQDLVDLAEDNVEFEFGAVLRANLQDPDEEVRALAAEGLWEDEEPSTALALLDALGRDASPKVRAAAASSLGHFAYKAGIGESSPTIAGKLRQGLLAAIYSAEEPVEVRRRAVEAIAYLDDPEVQGIIERAHADPDEQMRASAVFAMGRNCDGRWLDTIVAEMKNPRGEIRFEAARSAGELGDQKAARPLVLLLADDDREVRLAAIAALGEIGGDTAVKALRYLLKEGDDEVKAAAAEALEELTFTEDPLRAELGSSD